MTVRVSELRASVLTAQGPTTDLDRLEAHSAAGRGTGGTAALSTARAQVLLQMAPSTELDRVEAHSGVTRGTGGSARLSGSRAQVLLTKPGQTDLDRFEAHSAAQRGSGGDARLSGVTLQVLVANMEVEKPIPIPLTQAELAALTTRLQNWAEATVVEHRWLTDVTRSPQTYREGRWALRGRPERMVRVHWLQDEPQPLLAALRRQGPMPLYPDEVRIEGPAGQVLFGDFARRRFFKDGRVAVYRTDRLHDEDAVVTTITGVSLDRIELADGIAWDMEPGKWAAVPLLDVHPQLEPAVMFHTDSVAQVDVDAEEIGGRSALPPVANLATETGWPTFEDLPWVEWPHDWADGNVQTRVRYGSQRELGRSQGVEQHGPREVWRTTHNVLADRETWWKTLSLFDALRGRAGCFWEVDSPHIAPFEVADTDAQFIYVSPVGSFSDFVAYCQETERGLCVVGDDGSRHVRKVATIQEVAGQWRLTLELGEDDLPDDVTGRLAAVRRKRFYEDLLVEEWLTAELVRLRFEAIEVLDED